MKSWVVMESWIVIDLNEKFLVIIFWVLVCCSSTTCLLIDECGRMKSTLRFDLTYAQILASAVQLGTGGCSGQMKACSS